MTSHTPAPSPVPRDVAAQPAAAAASRDEIAAYLATLGRVAAQRTVARGDLDAEYDIVATARAAHPCLDLEDSRVLDGEYYLLVAAADAAAHDEDGYGT